MRTEYKEETIESVIAYFVKDYVFHRLGESLADYDFYYDPKKGKVLIRLNINEEGE